MAPFDPSLAGIFLFGLAAGICPCNSVLCLGLIGYLTSGKTTLSLPALFRLSFLFCAGTALVLVPLGALAGFIGGYLIFLNSTVAWAAGGIIMIAMGLQLLHLYKLPVGRIYRFFRMPASYTSVGAFLLGLSFGAITLGRGAPMLLAVLTYIALSQGPASGLVTMTAYAAGLCLPLMVISTIGGAAGSGIRKKAKERGDLIDFVAGVLIIAAGIWFLYLAFS